MQRPHASKLKPIATQPVLAVCRFVFFYHTHPYFFVIWNAGATQINTILTREATKPLTHSYALTQPLVTKAACCSTPVPDKSTFYA